MTYSLQHHINLYQAGLINWKELNKEAEAQGGKVSALHKRITGKGWTIRF